MNGWALCLFQAYCVFTFTVANALIDADHYVTNEPDNILYGNVNGDGKVTARDSMIVQRYAIKLTTLTDEQLKAVDVDKNGKVNAKDALYILGCSINPAVLPMEN